MLVLGREENESIVMDTLNGEITIWVVRVGDNRVRIGLDAPKNVNIRRGEIEYRQGGEKQ